MISRDPSPAFHDRSLQVMQNSSWSNTIMLDNVLRPARIYITKTLPVASGDKNALKKDADRWKTFVSQKNL